MDNYNPFEPGFDPGFFVGTHNEIGPALKGPSDKLVQLNEAVKIAAAGPIVNAGVTYNELMQIPIDQITQKLSNASSATDKLQNQVRQVVANRIGAIGEKTVAFNNALAALPNANIVALQQANVIAPPIGNIPANPLMPIANPPPPNLGANVPPQQFAAPPNIGNAADVAAEIAANQAAAIANNPFWMQPTPPKPPPNIPPQPQQFAPPHPPQFPPNWVAIANPNGGVNWIDPNMLPPGVPILQPQFGNAPPRPLPFLEPPAEPQIQQPAQQPAQQPQQQPAQQPAQQPGVNSSNQIPGLDCYSPGQLFGAGVTDPLSQASRVGIGSNPLGLPPCSQSATQANPTVNQSSQPNGNQVCSLGLPDFLPPVPGTYCKDLLFPISTVTASEGYNLASSLMLPWFASLQANTDQIEQQQLVANSQAQQALGGGLVSIIGGAIDDAIVKLKADFLGGIWQLGIGIAGSFDAIAKVLVPLGGCTSSAAANSAAIIAGIGLLDKYIGGPWDYLATPVKYKLQGQCPVFFPGIDGGQAAYLGDNIDLDVLKNWVAISGHCWEPYSKVLESAKSKPIPDQLLQMNRRQIINDSEYKTGMRRLGYVDNVHIENIKKIGEYAPPPQDIVRFMVRDTANDAVVTTFELDKHFGDNYNGQLKEWAKWSGVSDDYMKHLWRAHWDVPSPTQLYTMLHRLSALPPDDPKYVSIDTVRMALVQQDIAPFWIEKFIAISYAPLTRVDVRRAYNIGVLNRDEVKRSYLDNGYNDFNAETLTKFTEKEKMRAGYSHISVKRYIAGRIHSLEMMKDLIGEGYSPEQIELIVARAKNSFRWQWAGSCVKATKKRYMIGEFDKDKVRQILIGFGMEGEQANIISEGWDCELAAKGREFTGAQLVKLLDNGLLNPQEFVSRLRRLGFREDDALKVLTQWQIKQQLIQQKITERQAAQLEKNMLKQAKLAEQQAKKQERAAKDYAKAGENARRAQDRRDSALVKAARDYSVQEGITIEEAFEYVKVCYKEMREAYSLSLDQSIVAVVVAIEKRPPADEMPLCERIREAAEAIIDADSIASQN